MITQDNLNIHDGLYARARGVLANSNVVITDATGATGKVKDLAADRGFDANTFDNIHIYFYYLDILAAYEAAQILTLSAEGTPEALTYTKKVKEVVDGLVVEKDVVVTGEEFQPIFTMLPADEPRFKVNLNTRRIESPVGFIGQQVQNDNFAETLWFEVDRYFDATDLFGTDISIQWEIGKEKGITEAFNPMANLLVDDLYGKIIFGWPLTSEITKVIGNVRFSIRFCKKDEVDGSIIYNLTTLPMNLKINESLIIEPNSEIEILEPHTRFYNNLKKKSFYTVIPAAVPELAELYGLNATGTKIEGKGNLKEDGTLVLEARGEVSNSNAGRAGAIDYEWVRYYEDDKGIQQDTAKGVLVEKNDKVYSQLTADEAGFYGVIIGNTYGGNTQYYTPPYKKIDEVNGSISLNKEGLFEIPFASAPVFNTIGEKEIINKAINSVDSKISFSLSSGLANGDVPSYQWYYSADNGVSDKYSAEEEHIVNAQNNELVFDPHFLVEGYYKLEATNSLNKTTATAKTAQAYRVTKMPVAVGIANFISNDKPVEVAEGTTMIVESGKAKIEVNIEDASKNNGLFDSKLDSDNVEVKWYYFTKDGAKTIAPNYANGALIVDHENEEGRYTCEVITTYNGASASLSYEVYIGV